MSSRLICTNNICGYIKSYALNKQIYGSSVGMLAPG